LILLVEREILTFLNLCIIQSPSGVSIDQTQHITSIILGEYFKGVSSSSIPFKPFPFPIEPAFEQELHEAAPLVGPSLKAKEKEFGFAFSHVVGGLMHIAGITRIDLSYAYMFFSGYMACPNIPIFYAFHRTMCYLYHHKHLPIMYLRKPLKKGGNILHTFWNNRQAEYLSADFGDDFATLLPLLMQTMPTVFAAIGPYCILFNGVVLSFGCKKQLKMALHNYASEVNALFKGIHKLPFY
jgi:hypothetical protein